MVYQIHLRTPAVLLHCIAKEPGGTKFTLDPRGVINTAQALPSGGVARPWVCGVNVPAAGTLRAPGDGGKAVVALRAAGTEAALVAGPTVADGFTC